MEFEGGLLKLVEFEGGLAEPVEFRGGGLKSGDLWEEEQN